MVGNIRNLIRIICGKINPLNSWNLINKNSLGYQLSVGKVLKTTTTNSGFLMTQSDVETMYANLRPS